MSMINKEINAFSAQAFVDNAFKTVTKEDVLGKWSIFFFYPADFTFVCPTELEEFAARRGQRQRSEDLSESLGKVLTRDPSHCSG